MVSFVEKSWETRGADVIKIERPGEDAARRLGPFYHSEPHLEKCTRLSRVALNTSECGITLNFESNSGKTFSEG